MAYIINDDCVMCGSCAGACPSEAISEGDGKYVINHSFQLPGFVTTFVSIGVGYLVTLLLS